MENLSDSKLQQLEVKIDAIRESVEKTRRYFQITMWVTILFFVVPLVALFFVLPMFLNSYLGAIDVGGDPSSADSLSQSQLELLQDLLK